MKLAVCVVLEVKVTDEALALTALTTLEDVVPDTVQTKLVWLLKPLLGNVIVFPPEFAVAVPDTMCGPSTWVIEFVTAAFPEPVRWAVRFAPELKVPLPTLV